MSFLLSVLRNFHTVKTMKNAKGFFIRNYIFNTIFLKLFEDLLLHWFEKQNLLKILSNLWLERVEWKPGQNCILDPTPDPKACRWVREPDVVGSFDPHSSRKCMGSMLRINGGRQRWKLYGWPSLSETVLLVTFSHFFKIKII